MDKEFKHEEVEYIILESKLREAESVCGGRPDIFQYNHNELTREIARFLLRPYQVEKMKK